MNDIDFVAAFSALTGNAPFPWQKALYDDWFAVGKFPQSCNLPTGLGKTLVIAIWLIALANYPAKMPRRLVYVVNRRTVVDQTTDEVEKYRAQLEVAGLSGVLRSMCAIELKPDDSPLALSTLRGQFADNREWSADPARPAVICGTVDMIGSRLLFSGYGIGFKTKPLHAGFLGQDVLLIHDEAHLEPAFQELLVAIQKEQERCKDFGAFRVMELSATSRGSDEVFELTPDEQNPPNEIPDPPQEPIHVAWRRQKAKKAIYTHENTEESKLAEEIATFALKFDATKHAVLVFVRKVEDVEKVVKELPKLRTRQLTGTLRGLERDRLVGDPIFRRFLPKAVASDETVYLVCSSAGEVGVNITADHLVCDLSTFDSMAQRLGRVNRFGDRDDTEVHIVIPAVIGLSNKDVVEEAQKLIVPKNKSQLKVLILRTSLDDVKEVVDELTNQEFLVGTSSWPTASDSDRPNKKVFCVTVFDSASGASGVDTTIGNDLTEFEKSLARTRNLICDLPKLNGLYDGSPKALAKLNPEDRLAAFAPEPTILPVSDFLFDSWALTTIRGKLPGRPPVEPYLHGLSAWEPPETHVAWRQEVGIITRELLDECRPEDLLEDYPLKPHELLRDSSSRVFDRIKKLQAEEATPIWIASDDDTVKVTTLGDLIAAGKELIERKTVLLPPSAGGLENGMLTSDSKTADDVSDRLWNENGQQRRIRVWDETPVPADMRRVRQPIDIKPDADEDEEEQTGRRFWNWYELPKDGDSDGSKSNKLPVLWEVHVSDVVKNATGIVNCLPLADDLKKAINFAARYHDHGKRRKRFQAVLGNFKYPEIALAKSGKKGGRLDEPYRHEFGSLLDVQLDQEFKDLNPELQDIVLHLIAVHHGYGRPHFPAELAFDPDPPAGSDSAGVAMVVPQRFARLQRKYGRWGLAYLESLLRAADYAASAKPSAFVEEEK